MYVCMYVCIHTHTYIYIYLYMFVRMYDKFSVAPNPVNASSIKVSPTSDIINVIWKVCQ